jgi:hypothetical protein
MHARAVANPQLQIRDRAAESRIVARHSSCPLRKG